MRVKAAARRFDRTPARDAYTGAFCFMGQLGLYDDSHRDSESTERRTFSTSAEAKLPARRVISAAGLQFILGHGFPDTYRGEVIRVGYVAHEAPTLARVRTLAEACTDSSGVQAWGSSAWVKNSADERSSSTLTQQHNLHFAVGEPIGPLTIVDFGQDSYIVRDSRVGPAGTLIAFADRLQQGCFEVAQISTGSWDPITETLGAPHAVRLLKVRWQSLYEYRSALADRLSEADLQFVVAKVNHDAKPGQDVNLAAGQWRIKTVDDLGDVWVCGASRHA